MNAKEKVLQLLLKSNGEHLSGEQMANTLGVSRAAVWKSVKQLEKDGFVIDAISNKGYAIDSSNDVLTEVGIKRHLDKKNQFSFEVYDRVESTNKLMREKTTNDEGFVILSQEQTKGVGRLDRYFFSPKNSGLYMSLLLKPQLKASETIYITTTAAVAVCKAIEKVCDEKPQIKWVNDIFVGERKVCGILTQGSFNMENSLTEYIILGIGINVYAPENGFPEEINEIASYLLKEKKYDFKNQLSAQILSEFWDLYKNYKPKQINEMYKTYCFVIGRDVMVHKLDERFKAKVLDINENCNLIVQYENGEIQTLDSGEISIKL